MGRHNALSPDQVAMLGSVVREMEELGLSPLDVWKRVKEEIDKRKKKIPTPPDPRNWGPPGWLIAALAVYLMWRLN